MNEKRVYFYANCQGTGISHFLKKSKQFCEMFDQQHIVTYNYVKLQEKSDLDIQEIIKSDLFIYQPLDDRYEKLSTNYILERINAEKTICYSFPYLYNDGLWELFEEGDKIKGGEIIMELIQQNYSLNEIVNLYNNLSIDFNLRERFNYCLDIVTGRETDTDLRIADFIINNIKEKELFITQNHPTSHIFLELTNQILHKLNMDPISYEINEFNLNEINLPLSWPNSTYQQKEFPDMTYKKEKQNNDFYIDLIKRIYSQNNKS